MYAQESTPVRSGSVTFVGAGPGAADLITIRGLKTLTTAEVVSSVARIVHNQERLGKMRSQQTAIAPRGSSRRIAELIGQIAISGRRPTIPAAG